MVSENDQVTRERSHYTTALNQSVLIEQHDEWEATKRRYFSEHSMKLLGLHPKEVKLLDLEAAETTTTDHVLVT